MELKKLTAVNLPGIVFLQLHMAQISKEIQGAEDMILMELQVP